MNLYRINVRHFSQKDSHTAIETYLLAEDDEAVYNWLDKKQFDVWSDRNNEDGPLDICNDDYEVIGTESYKEKMLRIKGELNDEDLELSDLYYGATIYGWQQESGQLLGDKVATLKGLKVLIEA